MGMDMVDTVLDMPDTDMELTHMAMVDMVLDMPVTDMLDTHMPLDTLMVVTHMPMELTTERDPLMPLTCMELMDMVDMVLDMPDTDMDTHMPMWIWIPICLWKVNYSRDC